MFLKDRKDENTKYKVKDGFKSNNEIFKIDINQNKSPNLVNINPNGADEPSEEINRSGASLHCKQDPFVRSLSDGMMLFREKQCRKCD